MNSLIAEMSNVQFENQHPSQGDRRKELLQGLQQPQKSVNPKYFYDARGSELFDQITRLFEYYPTRTEKQILQRYRSEIADYCGRGSILIEPGGSSEKVRLLLDALKPAAYVPIDISAEFLYQSAMQLGEEFPWLKIHAVCADFNHDWAVSSALPQSKKVFFYPGSTIGNMDPAAAASFLSTLREKMGRDGGVLIGVDLHKSEQRLNAAYNDSQGITADFNLNILTHINPLLDAEFSRETFSHHAFYNTDEQRIEMHLVSDQKQTVRCNGSAVSFEKGETIHTENSYKYTLEGFAQLAQSADLEVQHSWLDEEKLFSVHYLESI